MRENVFIKNINWACPSLEEGIDNLRPNKKNMALFCDTAYVKEKMEERREKNGKGVYILPLWQNIEALVLGEQLMKGRGSFRPGKYCLSELSDFKTEGSSISDHPIIKTMLSVLKEYKEEKMILEVAAPFSILGALMNPMDLYLCFSTEKDQLKKVLFDLAGLQAAYIREAICAGAKVLSIADPIGTVDLIGEAAFKECVADSELVLLKELEPFLNESVIHLCKKMTLSLLLADKIGIEEKVRKEAVEDFYDGLRLAAADQNCAFLGLSCIHHKNPDLRTENKIFLK